ncbi:MAG TPA: Gfo/Idh/MocA family oxidoreductase [Elusimicrobiota bacterium]|nr:Gfo/Idh/MocA family oxidoreductase [Elusimicrobiota bacterium]
MLRRLFSRKKTPVPPRPVLPDAERLAVGIVGVGHLGQHHVRLLAGIPEAKLVGITDLNMDRARSLAVQHGTRAFERAEDFLPQVKAVVIATPTPTHHALAKKFLQAGHHCFVEKPLTERVAEAEEVIALARANNLVLQVGHVERFNPAVEEMIRRAQNPLFIEANRLGPYDPRVAHVSVVLDLMIHDIDIVLAMVKDKVVKFDAVGAKVFSDQEDIVKVTLHFSRGCRADLSASRVSLQRFRKIRVFQKDAYMSLDYSERSLKVYRKKSAVIRNLLDVAVEHPKLEKKDPLESELKHFVQCVKDGKPPLVGGEHGRDALELALEIRRAAQVHSL